MEFFIRLIFVFFVTIALGTEAVKSSQEMPSDSSVCSPPLKIALNPKPPEAELLSLLTKAIHDLISAMDKAEQNGVIHDVMSDTANRKEIEDVKKSWNLRAAWDKAKDSGLTPEDESRFRAVYRTTGFRVCFLSQYPDNRKVFDADVPGLKCVGNKLEQVHSILFDLLSWDVVMKLSKNNAVPPTFCSQLPCERSKNEATGLTPKDIDIAQKCLRGKQIAMALTLQELRQFYRGITISVKQKTVKLDPNV